MSGEKFPNSFFFFFAAWTFIEEEDQKEAENLFSFFVGSFIVHSVRKTEDLLFAHCFLPEMKFRGLREEDRRADQAGSSIRNSQ